MPDKVRALSTNQWTVTLTKVSVQPIVRPATANDCVNLSLLAGQVWLHTYAFNGIRDGISQFVQDNFTPANFEKQLKDPDWKILVCQQGPFLVGFVSLNLTAEFEHRNNGFEIDKFYVYPHCHGQGIGKALHQAIIDQAGSRFWLSTWVHNDNAISFYKHLGFQDIGITWFDFEGKKHENRILAYKDDVGT